MPYIVTTKREVPTGVTKDFDTGMWECDDVEVRESRRAVATLEEVEYETGHVFGNEGGRWTRPDRTVIAVERISYNHLRWEAGWTPSAGDEDYSAAHRHGPEVIAAFNAMEADRAA